MKKADACSEAGDEVERLEQHVGGPIAKGVLQLIDHQAIAVAAQALWFSAIVGPASAPADCHKAPPAAALVAAAGDLAGARRGGLGLSRGCWRD